MDARQERGLVIAARCKITRVGMNYFVPSQTHDGNKYTVRPDSERPHCNCQPKYLTQNNRP
jgi:hypothetical protein